MKIIFLFEFILMIFVFGYMLAWMFNQINTKVFFAVTISHVPTWKIILSFIIDFALTLFIFGYSIAWFLNEIKDGAFNLKGIPALILFSLVFAYFMVMNRCFGGTIGKKILGISTDLKKNYSPVRNIYFALIFDFILSMTIFGYIVAWWFNEIKDDGFHLTGLPALILTCLIASYFLIMNTFFGSTFGKKLFKPQAE